MFGIFQRGEALLVSMTSSSLSNYQLTIEGYEGKIRPASPLSMTGMSSLALGNKALAFEVTNVKTIEKAFLI